LSRAQRAFDRMKTKCSLMLLAAKEDHYEFAAIVLRLREHYDVAIAVSILAR
jgi:hypothetical protein